MAESSTMAESSSTRTRKEVITIKLKPVLKLQQSISALCDFDFNPDMMVRLDITKKGFEITVRNPQTNVIGHFHLDPCKVIKYKCRKSIPGKLITISELYMHLINAPNQDDFVTIFHLLGSDHLTLLFGSDPAEHHVLLFDMKREIEKIPNEIIFFSEAILTSKYLRQMIKRLEEPDMPQEVSVEIEKRFVTFYVRGKYWILEYKSEEVAGSRGVQPGQKNQAVFTMHHSRALEKASSLTEYPVVSFLSKPEGHVMMRFRLKTLGELVFIYTATRVVKNSQEKIGSGSQEEGSGSREEEESGSREVEGSDSDEENRSGFDFAKWGKILSRVYRGGRRHSLHDSDVQFDSPLARSDLVLAL